MARWALLGLAMLVGLTARAAIAAAPLPALPADDRCAIETGPAERAYGIPAHLLDAISVVESGRWDDQRKATVAWPWTVMAQGNGKFFPTKGEAIAEVQRLRRAGVRNIDVGCMQVNLQYHPDAFATLEEAFDPVTNVAYAARFLKGLYGATNHWPTAAAYYHSQTPELAAEYKAKLMKVWTDAPTMALASAAPSGLSMARRPTVFRGGAVGRAQPAAVRDDPERDEARRIANAYRQAKLAEYQLRRERMIAERQSGVRVARGSE